MADQLVVLRKYTDEVSAQLAALILEANGVPARVVADTAGGALPSLALVFPVRLMVREEDEEFARELLDSDVEDESDADN
ncbi:MAG: putative signal transducing protein [Gemmatimonadaceae bacterium]